MLGSGWILDTHTILMVLLLIVAVVYLIQNSNNEAESQSKQLIPVRRRKRAESKKEFKESKESKESFSDKAKTPVKFVMYYVSWCPHCKTAKPEWKKLEDYASKSLPWATVESIDCEKNPAAAEKNDIQYFPTILITKDGNSSEYEGPRVYADIKKFLEEY